MAASRSSFRGEDSAGLAEAAAGDGAAAGAGSVDLAVVVAGSVDLEVAAVLVVAAVGRAGDEKDLEP